MCEQALKCSLFILPFPLYTQSLSRGLGLLLIGTKPVVASFGSSRDCRVKYGHVHVYKHAKILIFKFVSCAFSCLLCEEVNEPLCWMLIGSIPVEELSERSSTKNKFLTPSQDSRDVSSDPCCWNWHRSLGSISLFLLSCHPSIAFTPCLYFSHSVSPRSGCLMGKRGLALSGVEAHLVWAETDVVSEL